LSCVGSPEYQGAKLPSTHQGKTVRIDYGFSTTAVRKEKELFKDDHAGCPACDLDATSAKEFVLASSFLTLISGFPSLSMLNILCQS